ncbi:MAG: response regulator [Candidatus Margulisiibacteriota bacterium]
MTSKRILVVDDEEDILWLNRLLLQKAGYEVETALSGIEGLGKLASFDPQVVLLDVNLPGEQGLDVFREMKRQFPDTKVVLCSAMIPKETSDFMASDGFLPKPYTKDDLMACIETQWPIK